VAAVVAMVAVAGIAAAAGIAGKGLEERIEWLRYIFKKARP
jgi:hypothetical protein